MKLVLCDAHAMFLEALTTALTRLGREIEAVSQDADHVVDLVVEHQPEVCVLDVSFAGSSGLDAAVKIRGRAPAVKVLLLTGAATEEVWGAYDSRVVDGVVNKVCDIDLLQTSISRVARGERVVEGWLREGVRHQQNTPQREGLTDRERQVLELLVEGATTQTIAKELDISGNTVRTHVQNLLHKLGVHGRVKAANMAVARRLLEPPPAAG